VTDERLGREARELIEQALREESSADPSELARIRKRVLAVSVGVGALSSAGKSLAVPGAGAAIGAVSIMKAALLGASAAVLAVGLSSVLEREKPTTEGEPYPPSMPAPALRTAHVERAAGVEKSDAPAQERSKVPVVASQSQKASRAISAGTKPQRERESPGTSPSIRHDAPGLGSSDTSLLEEVALLERVQAALRAGDGAQALSLLDKNTSVSGSGQLGSERLAAEVFAACLVGNRARASRAARHFFQEYSATPASARVRASCAGEGSEP
jgi:hypothetical protein